MSIKPIEIGGSGGAIPGTTPHCLVNTEGNVNTLGTRAKFNILLALTVCLLWR